MSELADESVQCVVTSPPYWGLRKYEGNQELIWGGNKDCEHQWVSDPIPGEKSGPPGPNATVGARFAQDAVRRRKPTNTCSLCGAWKGQFGLEPTPELYVLHTVQILREIRRVLRKDGVVFWNIGDSYASQAGGYSDTGSRGENDCISTKTRGAVLSGKRRQPPPGLKPKDLCLIPFRVAIAAQSDGWYVRSVIIWSKNNPMPESVTDRPTNTYEFILMLTKSGTTQYWTHRDHEGTRKQPKPDYRWQRRGKPDMKAIAKEIGGMSQRTVWEERDGEDRGWREAAERQHSHIVEETDIKPDGWTRENKMGWDRINLWEGHDYYWDADAVREVQSSNTHSKGTLLRDTPEFAAKSIRADGKQAHKDWNKYTPQTYLPNGRNLRDVWTFPTTPFPSQFVNGEKLDHFAVFPEKIPELCIKAASSEKGCCPKCGAPWARVIDKKPSQFNIRVRDAWAGRATPEEGYKATEEEITRYPGNHPDMGSRQTLGWRPTCDCGLDPIPCTVLDPFVGSGTTLLVATKLGRKSIGYDISESYCKMAVNRNKQGAL